LRSWNIAISTGIPVDNLAEGINIFSSVVDEVGVKHIIRVAVGVREGVFLSDMLRGESIKFVTLLKWKCQEV